MMAWSKSLALSATLCCFTNQSLPSSSSSSFPLFQFLSRPSSSPSCFPLKLERTPSSSSLPSFLCSFYKSRNKQGGAAIEYKFPDPIPQFAEAETEKFRVHLRDRLTKKDVCGDSLEEVVGVCTEIFSTFLHTEYGGPGTLLINPFIDMADTVKERGLPGGSQAARSAVVWAQKHVDEDWEKWIEDHDDDDSDYDDEEDEDDE